MNNTYSEFHTSRCPLLLFYLAHFSFLLRKLFLHISLHAILDSGTLGMCTHAMDEETGIVTYLHGQRMSTTWEQLFIF